MSVDTPGSKVDRKMETNFELSLPKKKFSMDLRSPFKKIVIDGDLDERKKFSDYGAKLKLTVDDKKEYSLDGNLKVC